MPIPRSFVGVLMCRFFLGFVEAAFFPGALLLLSRYVHLRLTQRRNPTIYSSDGISGVS